MPPSWSDLFGSCSQEREPANYDCCDLIDFAQFRAFGWTSRNQKGRRRPSAVRATLDDPPIYIRPTVPAISGCKAKEPFRFRPLRHMPVTEAKPRAAAVFRRAVRDSGPGLADRECLACPECRAGRGDSPRMRCRVWRRCASIRGMRRGSRVRHRCVCRH